MSEVRTPLEASPSATSEFTPGSIAPCPNITAFRIQYWHWNQGAKKSESARESLIRDVISQPDFVPSDVSNIRWDKLDDHLTLLRTVQLAFAKNDRQFFHYDPYENYCCDPKSSKTYRTYGEAYESQRMISMHRKVQDVVLDEPCELPWCVAAIMIFSDATQLANFGNAKAWPIRVTFRNISKYEHCKPDSKNHYEVGFIPSLPADLQDKIRKLEGGRVIPMALLTHLRRELLHEMWKYLLDDDFLHA
ncbi:hypothetical protein FRC06_010136, partial [Ceratobasidium sp. 370]